jgi:hypothetical protein
MESDDANIVPKCDANISKSRIKKFELRAKRRRSFEAK